MSGAVRQRGAAPPAPSNKAPPDSVKLRTSNGNGGQYGTLSYPSDVTDDVNMNEVDGPVTLNVTLPNGSKMDINIDYNTPMLDLLVCLAAKGKLNPSGLTLQLISEDTGKPLAYKPNQTIGALGGREVYIVNKQDNVSKESKKKRPFEMTHRFTINLPRGQKSVSRVSPITTLGEVMLNVCKDKGLDPNRHVLQLPGQAGVAVDPAATVGQTGVFEMNLVNLAHQDKRNQALSMPDLSQVPQREDKIPSYMPSSGESKKKKGFFSFLSRKDKKFKPNDALYNIETSSTTSHMMSSNQTRKMTYQQSYPARRGSDTGLEHTRPKSMFAAASAPMDVDNSKSSEKENMQSQVAAPARKKRRAPAPPVPQNVQNKTQPGQNISSTENFAPKMENEQNAKLHKETISDVSPSNQKDVNSTVSTSQLTSRAEMLSRLHSRNSSDSSGYHELTLSGCESPEASHGVIKAKNSLDSASIESADHTNGDSGIHESPIRVSPIEEVLERSDSVAVVAASAPSKPEDTTKPRNTLPSKKKKKAPAPPPLLAPQPEPQPEPEPQAEPVEKVAKPVEEVVFTPELENVQMSADIADSTHLPENLDAKEESDEDVQNSEDTGFDIDDILSNVKFDEEAAPFKPIVISGLRDEDGAGEDSMMMVETASVSSENIDQMDVISKSDRPCAFIPPPPPTEPPPADEPQVDIEFLKSSDKPQFVDKGTGVNEDNTSLAPSSVKNSPELAHHRRLDSYSSVGSVDTIEGISLDFQMAIRMGQETLSPSLDDMEVSSDGYKNEMALFVERMSKMAVENSHADANHLNESSSSGLSIPLSDSNSETGSVIRHSRNASNDSKSLSDSGTPRSKDSKSDPDQMHTDFNVSEEIMVQVETVPPPPEFGDDGERKDDNESDEEDIVETVEEIIIPMGPGGYDFRAAQKVSEVTTVTSTSKEPKRDKKGDDYGVFRAEPVSITPIAEPKSFAPIAKPVMETHIAEPITIEPVPEPMPVSQETKPISFNPVVIVNNDQPFHPSEPAEKEEFVLTTEDLSNVTFLPPKPRTTSQSTPVVVDEPDGPSSVTTLIMAKSAQKPYLNSYNAEENNRDSFTQDIQSRVSQLSFTPGPESEADSVLEEKPITLLNQMPSMRMTVELETSFNGHSEDSSNGVYPYSSINSENVNDTNYVNGDQDFTDSAIYVSQTSSDTVEFDEERPVSRASITSVELAEQQEAMQSQYNALQGQFAQWQEQLERNQSMLASENSGGEVQSEQLQQLASQMAMQQDMMMQLQSSMQALQLQQEQVNDRSDHKAASIEVEQAAAAAESALRSSTPPTAPPLPAAPTVGAGDVIKSEVKVKPVKASKSRSNPKFERQLDPREELMVAIRSFNGREKLRSVPARETKWIHANR